MRIVDISPLGRIHAMLDRIEPVLSLQPIERLYQIEIVVGVGQMSAPKRAAGIGQKEQNKRRPKKDRHVFERRNEGFLDGGK